MNEQVQQIYDLYVQSNLINPDNVDAETFSSANPEQLTQLYQLGVDNELFRDTDQETFMSAFNTMEVKKKDTFDSTAGQEDMASDVETTSTELAPPPNDQITITDVVDEEYKYRDPNKKEGSDEVKTAFEKKFGVNPFTDLVGDIWRAWQQGQAQGASIDESLALFSSGKNVSNEQIQEFIAAQKRMQEQGPSDEMQDFNKIYQKNGGGWLGFLKGVVKNPSVVPTLFVSSVSAMANPTVAAGAGTGAAVGGGAAGATTLGIGTIPGAIAGGIFGATTTLEAGLSFAEFLQEEIGQGKELTDANIRAVLEDEEAMGRIRRKALGRGITIGAIDAVTGGLTTKLVGSTAKGLQKAKRMSDKASKLVGAAAGIGTEAVGGSVGEVGGRLVAGQEMDVAEIGFEGIAGTTTAPLTVGMGLLKTPEYKLNGELVPAYEVIDLLEKGTPEEIAGAKIEIKNDDTLLQDAKKAKENVVNRESIKAKLKEAGVTDETQLEALTDLEIEKLKLKGNDTDAGKSKLRLIGEQIKSILDGGVFRRTEVTDDDGNTSSQVISFTRDYAIQQLKKQGIESPTEQQVDAKLVELLDDAETQIQGQAALDELTTTTETEKETITVDQPLTEDQKEIAEYFNIDVDENTETEFVGDNIILNKNKRQQKSDAVIDETTIEESTPTPEVAPPVVELSVLQKIAQSGMKAVKALVPDVKIVFHETTDLFNKHGQEGANAEYDINNKTIHVNSETASLTTIPHELFHAVLVDKIGADTAAVTAKMINAVQQSLGKESVLRKRLEQFAANYDTSIQNEEQLAELTGILAANFKNLSKPEKNFVLKWLKELGQKIGFQMSFIKQLTTDEEAVIDLLNTLSTKFRTGEQVTAEDVQYLAGLTPQERQVAQDAQRQQQLSMDFDTSELTEDFNADEFFEQKKIELGDDLKAAEATQMEVERRKAAQPKPKKQAPKKLTLAEISKRFNMDSEGFIPANNILSRVQELVKPLGLSAKRAESGAKDIYITKNDRKINPNLKRQQKGKPVVPARKTMPKQEMSLDAYIKEGREAGFTDVRIKEFLTKTTRKYKASEVNKALSTNVPKSFTSMKGGQKAGAKLMKKIMSYQAKLFETNSKRANPLPDSQIVDKVVEYIESLPEFKQESDTYKRGGKTVRKRGHSKQQALMITEAQTLLEGNPTTNVANRLRNLKVIASSMQKSERNLQALKRDLKNYMRRYLPKGVYTRTEALTLVREIARADKNNIQEVMTKVDNLVVKKNVEILNSNLDNILNDKYTRIENGIKKGVKIDNETRKKIDKVKKYLGNYKKLSVNEIIAKKTKLLSDFNVLSVKDKLSSAEISDMVSLDIAINLLEANILEDTNASKAEILGDANMDLTELIDSGKTQLAAELQAAHEKYKKEMVEAYSEITGEEIDINDPKFEDKIKRILSQLKTDKKNKERQEGRLTKYMKKIGESINLFINRSEALDGLMDLISKLPGEMFGGKLQKLVVDKIDAASRVFKKRRMEMEQVMQNKLQELYGKNWEKKSRKNRVQVDTGIYTNNEVQKAKEMVEKDPTPENKSFYEQMVAAQPALKLSPNQMYYLVNQFKDPINHPSFAADNAFGPDYKRVMQEMKELLETQYPKLNEFANWQVNELFPSLYEHYNKVYRKIYRTDMPWNQNYAGRIYKEGTETQPLNLLGENGAFVGTQQVTGDSTHIRTDNPDPIRAMDGTDALLTYLNDMEYFAAYAESIRDVNKIFTNPTIKDAITTLHSQDVYGLIKDSITRVANRASTNAKWAKIINYSNNVFIASRLALSPVIALKQLTSAITYANDIGIRNWIKYSVKNLKDVSNTWKEIRDNSVYMQDRKYNSILQVIESYSEEGMQSFVPGKYKQWYLNFLMYTTKWGDRTAIMLGGMPNYNYYKDQYRKANPKASEKEVIDHAIKKFEKDTKRTQQSGDIQDKDYYQTGDPFLRAMNMFLTTPKQYMRKEIQAIRALYRKARGQESKGTFGDNMRTFLMYHTVMPALFQYVALGLPGMLRPVRDDDEDDMLRAIVIGNTNAFFILGELIGGMADLVQDKPWDFSHKSLGIWETTQRILKKFKNFERTKTQLDKYQGDTKTRDKRDRLRKQEEKVDKAIMEFISELTTVGPSPAPALLKWWYNLGELDNPDVPPGEAIMRLLNYSDYQIQGKKEKPKKKKKISERDLKILDPKAYRDLQRQKELRKSTPEYKRQQKRKEKERREKERQLRRQRRR